MKAEREAKHNTGSNGGESKYAALRTYGKEAKVGLADNVGLLATISFPRSTTNAS